jgi:serine/threonine protein kinase
MGSTSPTTAIEVGDAIGGCRIVRLIGHGGMGAVYEAQQVSLERRVAVKVIKHPKMTGQEGVRERLIREARLAAKLNHPNIVQVFDVGNDGSVQFIIMEFLEGITFKELLAKEPKLPVGRLVQIAAQITRGLAAAHAERVVHRDIKPENILITSSGVVKITDFGAASFLVDAYRGKKSIIGTPGFVAPETLLQRPIDGRADMYALGLMIYAAAAGAHPFRHKDRKKVLTDQLHKVPAPLLTMRPEVPALFAVMVDRMCAKMPQERPSAAEFLAVLGSHRDWEKLEEAEEPKKSEAIGPVVGLKDSASPAPPQSAQSPAGWPKSDLKPEAGGKSILRAPLVREAAAKAEPLKTPARGTLSVDTDKKALILSAAPSAPESFMAKDLINQATTLLTKKDLRGAEECFRAALRMEPRNKTGLLGLARVYTEQVRYKEAVYELYVALVSGRVTARAILEDPHFVPLKVNEGFRTLIGQFWV